MTITDFLNRRMHLKQTPQRIISLVPSQTELLVDLGLEEKIVGITKFCVHPKHLRKNKTIVGGTKQVHLDKIKSLKPDIILCNKEENTKAMVEELSKIVAVHVSDIKTLEDNYKLIKDYSQIFDTPTIGSKLIDQIRNRHEDFKSYIKNKPQKKVGYLIWRDPWMAVGSDTFINHMLEVNNFTNVFGKYIRYPEIDISKLPELDLLLLSSEPYPFKKKHLEEIPISNEKIIFVNGEYFSWYGSRMINAFEYFYKLRQ